MDDARIQAILASYEDDDNVEKEEEKPRSPSPPANLDEFLKTLPEGNKDWPSKEDLDEILNLNLTIESVGLGSLEEIAKDLSKHARIFI